MDPRLKSDGSIVTRADCEIEALLRTELPKLVPGTTVWGEEQGFQEPGPNGLWLVDPVDGTSNYRFGSPLWGVSIGLVQDGQVVLGAIALPDLDEIYSAHSGGGATCNDVPLPAIRPGPIKNEELVSYSDRTLIQYAGHKLPGKMRYAGAFVIESTFMLKGHFRGVISHKANLYDVAASICMATELGAEICYFDGSALDIPALIRAQRIEKPFLIFPQDSGFRLPNI